MTTLTPEIETHWLAVQPFLDIHSEAGYDQAVERLNELLDKVGANESHPLYELLDTLGILIQAYEDTHFPMPMVTGADALQYLMEEHDLKQADLSEIGSQGVVSEILNGKRKLNVRQIRALAERFHVSPAVFI
ncbi:MAG: helix-turn-helix domain-containing protein [Caldilineaceae bacterium]|nr:helix-turn-helix domain-containing protein [Caldilineaceae bacterium]MCB0139794.1 helix-turn-helix domain-containing protein [Caldilineaceae bacterium]